MEPLKINPTNTTPEVIFDASAPTFEINGRSLPEHAISFYEPVLAWLSEYGKSPNNETVVHLRLDYFNTPSAKPLLDILRALDKIAGKGFQTRVQWYFKDDDDDMREVGEEYSTFIKTPIDMINF